MARDLITRNSDGSTVDLDKQEAEHADTTANAKRVILTDTDGTAFSSSNPLNVDTEITLDGATIDNIDIQDISAGTQTNDVKITLDGEEITVGSRSDLEGGGKISVGTTAVEVTFTGTTTSIIVSADTSNTGTLYIGKSNVTNTGGNAMAFLEAGESLTIDYNDSSNAVYVVASVSSQNFFKGALL